MAPPYSNQLPHPIVAAVKQSLAHIRDDVDSIWHTVGGSRRTIQDAREAIARADVTLARRLSERG
jgi:hypothetical protein